MVKKDVLKLKPCGHKFHEACINQSMNSDLENADLCPLCRTEIDIEQIPQEKRAEVEAKRNPEEHEDNDEENEGESRLEQIVQYENHEQRSVPFLGVVICYHNEIKAQYLNTSFDLTTNNTLSELKDSVLSQQDNIIATLPRDMICSARNALSMIGLSNPSNRTIQITNIHFTTPSNCSIPNFSNYNFNNDNNLTLGDLYVLYQETAKDFISNNYVSSVYNHYTEVWSPTGPDDPGEYTTNYFLDPNGPVMNPEFRARSNELQSTNNSICWLSFNIDCVRSGGRTRKNKKLKKTKKRKSTFLKKGKTKKY
jgi:hypothetical protein